MKSKKNYMLFFTFLSMVLLLSTNIKLFTNINVNSKLDKQEDSDLNYKQDSFLDKLHTSQAEDVYEPNDIRTSSYLLSSYENDWLSSIGGFGVQKDYDWYQIEITVGYLRLVVHLLFDDTLGDIDISVYNSVGTYITGVSSTTDNEYIDYILPSSGTYYLRIYGDNNGNTYDLLWDDIGTGATDDLYEEDDTYASANDISLNERTWISSISGLGIQSDYDWYKISVNSDALRLVVFCIFSDAAGDIDIGVFASDGTTLVVWSTSTSDNEGIDETVGTSGTYYIRVSYGNAGNTYDLWWDDLSSTDDWYEDNDLRTSAYDLTLLENTWLSSMTYGLGVQSDDDWYEISISPGEELLAVSLSFSDVAGDIDIGVYNSVGTYVTGSTSITNDEYIDYILSSSGTYYLKIYGDNNGNLYDLWWDDLAPPDDNYEENDDYSTAYDLTWDELTWLNTIDGYGMQSDNDWYEIDITLGYENLIVDLTFTDAAGDIDVSIYASDGTTVVTGSYSFTDNEYIDYILPSSGTYYIRIYGDNAGNSYDLWWDDLAPDDAYEENDDSLTAYSFVENTWLSSISGLGIQADHDWYEIDITSGYEYLMVNLTFTHSAGDVDIVVFNNSLGLVTGSLSVSDDEYIDYVLPSSGTYYLMIFGDNASNTYDLWWDDLVTPISDDNYEENDLPGEAYDLSTDDGTWLNTIDGLGIQSDYDWYEIYVPSGYEIVIINCTFTHSLGNINVQLWNTTGGLWGSFSTTDDENFEYLVPSSGTYYILVYGDDAGNSYDLRWDTEAPIADDAYEENDDPMTAYDLTTHPDTWLTAISGPAVQSDFDFYKVTITTTGQRLIIDLTYTYSEGPLVLMLVDSLLNDLAMSNTTANNEHIDQALTSTGTYYIIVAGLGLGNSYDLKYNVESAGDEKPIPGYNLLFLIGAVFGVSIVIIRKRIKKLVRIKVNS